MGVGPYDPIAVLVEEHRLFLGRLDEFSIEMRRLAELPRIPAPEVRRIEEFGRFLARDVDGWHGRKEEVALFPALERHLPEGTGPIGILLGEHEQLRAQQGTIERGGRRLAGDSEAREAFREVADAERATRWLLSDHISKEDEMLFPMARELLSPREMAEVADTCREIDAERRSSDGASPP